MIEAEIIEKIASIDEQIHDLRKMVLESSQINKEEVRSAARAWLTEAKKMEHKWQESTPTVLEMTKNDRRHDE